MLPIWMRPEPGGRKPRFTRAAIAKAAVAIADAEGFDAVSMRRIADKIGAGTMTLYQYVSTKAELLALMEDWLMGELLVPDAVLRGDWREALMAIARRTRDVFRKHPWALMSMRGAPPGPNSARHFEQCLAALSRTSFDRQTKLELLALIDDFVFGHALRAAEVRSSMGENVETQGAIQQWVQKEFETGAFPHTSALFGHADPEQSLAEVTGINDEEGRFERGLVALLNAAASRRPRPRPRRRTTNRARKRS